MEIVKGNDIKVVWAITKTVDNVNIPEDLSTATNIRFKVWCSGTLISVPDYSISGNEITFTIKGSVQRTGEYSFEVSYSKGYDARVVYKDAFLVVDLACQANYVKSDDIQVTTLQFYSSISSLYLWQLLDVKKSTTDNSVDKTFDKFYLGYDAKLKQWYGMKIPEETFKLEDMWKALDAENEIIPKSHLDLTGLATQEWVKQQIDNIPTGGGDIDINVVTQLVKDIIGKWFKEDENSDLYVVNKTVDGAEVERNFYTYGGLTAMGKSEGGGGGTGGASSLGQLTNVGDWADTTPTEDRLFIQKAGATHWSSMKLTDIKVDLSNYYTKSETNSAISKAVVDAVTPVQNLLNDHINNADIHVTLAEKTLWNKIASYFAEDSSQDIFVTNKADGTPRGFYSNSFISALGLNTGGGGGGMDEDLLWSILGDGDNPDKQIAVSHLTKALSPYSTTSQMNTAISEAVKGYIPLSQKGRAGGVVPLDNDGLISSMYLPSYVDDVLEYSTFSALPATGEGGKIYVTLDTNLTYRWSGTSYVEISKSLALGETADTAYAGNKGKENRDSINRLKNATFWGATYQANGNVYGTFNGTEIYLTNKIETPKIKIGDIFLEYDAERNAIKGVKYNSEGAEEMANFYMTGGITALGIASSGGISFTLQDLADTNISNPQDKQALVYDAASSKWVNGSAIGGGDISLNGTVYKPVDGVITLPGLYEKVSGGTASQFLKADGSIDDRKYALAYKGNINMVSKSDSSNTIAVNDTIYNMIPNVFDSNAVTVFYTNATTPTSDYWSGINVSGFNNSLNTTWQLGGPASKTNYNEHLHFRAGIGSTWDVNWKPLAFLEDIGNTVGNKGLYDATDGWLIKTNILDNENCMTQLYITGNSYGGLPIDTVVELYSYSGSNSILNFKVLHNGYFPSDGINAFSYGGFLCFWFAKSSIRFQSISVYCRQTNAATQINRVVSVHNSAMPSTGVTRLVYSTNYKSVRNDNFDSILGSTYVHKSGDTMTGLLTANYGILARDIRISATEEEVGEINRKATLWLQHRNWGDVGMCHAGGNILMGGKLIVDRNRYSSVGVPSISLAIGDTDTGLNWESDGIVNFMSNAKKVGEWRNTSAYLHNCSFVEASGNDYNNLGFQVRGNGTANTVKPGIGFHQPGVYAGSLRLDAAGSWMFCVQGGSVGGTVQAGSFWANGGWLYSKANGCEVRIGSQNTGFVHITNNAARTYYFDNSIDVSGTVYPYSDNAYDLGTSTHKWNYIWGNHFMGNSASSTFIQPNYIGGQQANPQTYFNNSMGVKVAMTGVSTNGSYWSDTLWINGYYGTDVPACNALHFPRDGSAEMYISSQVYNATSYGERYRFWTSKNSNKAGVNWSAETFFAGTGFKSKNICIETDNSGNSGGRGSEINNWNSHLYLQHASNMNLIMCQGGGKVLIGSIDSTYKLNVQGDIRATSWIRTDGATGWYSQSYGGGIYMSDSEQVRIYNNKVLYNDGIRTWGIGGHNCALKLYSSANVGINLANGSYTWGIYSNNDGNMYIGRRDGNANNSSGSYVITLSASTLSMAGNIGATGGITAMTSSDENLKNRLDYEVDYASKLLLLGRVFDFTYNDKALSRKDKCADRNVHTGLSWQKVRNILPTVCGMDKDGYGYINYISPDLISLIAGATQLNTLGIQSILDRTKSLEERVEILERRNKQLELKIKLIQR